MTTPREEPARKKIKITMFWQRTCRFNLIILMCAIERDKNIQSTNGFNSEGLPNNQNGDEALKELRDMIIQESTTHYLTQSSVFVMFCIRLKFYHDNVIM
jgi:hypothetical protein